VYVAELRAFLDEYREFPCAHLLETMILQIDALGADVDARVEPFAVRFCVGESTLCELSVYGQLFIARCGPGLAVEYRVRDEDVALRALDEVLREYMRLRDSPSPTVP
jgi:hypothetical protein